MASLLGGATQWRLKKQGRWRSQAFHLEKCQMLLNTEDQVKSPQSCRWHNKVEPSAVDVELTLMCSNVLTIYLCHDQQQEAVFDRRLSQ